MSRITCFWMTPIDRARQTLRRYQRVTDYRVVTCPAHPMKHHDASVRIEDVAYPFGEKRMLGEEGNISHDDPRWPKHCEACGYEFVAEDHWQHNIQRLFTGAPDGHQYTTRDMPPGAMFDADWFPKKGPDGIALAVVLPPDGGDDIWVPDSPPARGGSPWTRTGTIPRVTCQPSILTPRYHGFLVAGELVSC